MAEEGYLTFLKSLGGNLFQLLSNSSFDAMLPHTICRPPALNGQTTWASPVLLETFSDNDCHVLHHPALPDSIVPGSLPCFTLLHSTLLYPTRVADSTNGPHTNKLRLQVPKFIQRVPSGARSPSNLGVRSFRVCLLQSCPAESTSCTTPSSETARLPSKAQLFEEACAQCTGCP